MAGSLSRRQSATRRPWGTLKTLLLLLLAAPLVACGASSTPAEAPSAEVPPPSDESEAHLEAAEDYEALRELLGDSPRGPIPLVAPRPRLGPERAPITLILFSDMQCPFCVRVMPTLEQVMARYGDQVRLFWAHLPLPSHPQADVAARVSVAVFEAGGDEAFFGFLNELTSDLRDFSDARIEAVATRWGASREAVLAAMDDYAHDEAIVYDRKVAQALGIRGTPFTLINGRPVAGAQPLEAFTAVIDDELRVVAALNEAGVPRGREYETLVRLVFGPEVAAQMRETDD